MRPNQQFGSRRTTPACAPHAGQPRSSRCAFARWPALLGLLAVLCASTSNVVAAQWRPDGALSGQMLIRDGSARDRCQDGATTGCTEPGLGGGLQLDLFTRHGAFAVGPGMGLFAHGGADDTTRVFVPVTAALALSTTPRPIGLHAVLRPGFWFGATNVGLRGGAYLSGGAHLLIRLDDTVRLAAGLEITALFGFERSFFYTPTIGLHWALPSGAGSGD